LPGFTLLIDLNNINHVLLIEIHINTLPF